MTTEEQLVKYIGIDIKIDQVKIKDYIINYITCGEGEPLLLIHGGNIGWGQWFPNLVALSRHYKVIAIDLPGAGRSSQINYTKLDPGGDVFDVVDNFVERVGLGSFSVIGSSIGGWVGIKLALKYPQRIRKLILCDAVGLSSKKSFGDYVLGFFPLARLLSRTILYPKRSNKNIEKFIRSAFKNNLQLLPIQFIDYVYETISTKHNILFLSRIANLANEFSVGSFLETLKVPTLIIWGVDDKILPLKNNLHNIKKIINSQVEIFEKCGHIPSVEMSDKFNNLALNFLAG